MFIFFSSQVVERTQEILIQEQEIMRREKELEATVKQPADAEKFRQAIFCNHLAV